MSVQFDANAATRFVEPNKGCFWEKKTDRLGKGLDHLEKSLKAPFTTVLNKNINQFISTSGNVKETTRSTCGLACSFFMLGIVKIACMFEQVLLPLCESLVHVFERRPKPAPRVTNRLQNIQNCNAQLCCHLTIGMDHLFHQIDATNLLKLSPCSDKQKSLSSKQTKEK